MTCGKGKEVLWGQKERDELFLGWVGISIENLQFRDISVETY